MGCVYKISSPSGKSYVGITTQPFSKRYIQHKKAAKNGRELPLYRAMRKYGFENFSTEIMFESDDVEILKLLEIELISKLKTFRPSGYNCTLGGDGANGFKFTKESIEKISIASKRAWQNEEYVQNQKEAAKRRWQNEEYVERHKNGVAILMQSEEHIKKLSDRTKRSWELGIYNATTEERSLRNRGRNAKLSDDQILEIKKLLSGGTKGKEVARLFGISVSHVSGIKNGKKRGYVKEEQNG